MPSPACTNCNNAREAPVAILATRSSCRPSPPLAMRRAGPTLIATSGKNPLNDNHLHQHEHSLA
eukprot:6506359-Lingulodinium_polyedra.AAC.1